MFRKPEICSGDAFGDVGFFRLLPGFPLFGVCAKKSLALSAATFGLCGVLSVWFEDFPDLAPVGLTRAVFFSVARKTMEVDSVHQSDLGIVLPINVFQAYQK